ncbi:MAG: hypothetical protein MRY72_13025 [Aquisalinus sp.]|nr:hypothetical protein [Aquisalinus sp.]
MSDTRRVIGPRTRIKAAPLPQAITQSDGGQFAAGILQGLTTLGADVAQLADRSAERAGAKEGQFAGLDPEFRPRNDDTIRGRAFNAAARRTAGSQIEITLRQGIQQIYQDSGFDPVAFNEGLTNFKAQNVDTIADTDLRLLAEETFARTRFSYDRDIAREIERQRQVDAQAAAITDLSRRQSDIQREAYALGLDAAADQVIGGQVEALRRTLLAYGPKGEFTIDDVTYEPDATRGGVYSAAQIARQLELVAESVAEGRFKGAFDRTGSLAGREAFLDNFRESYQENAGLSGEISFNTFERLGNYFESGIRELKSEERARVAETRAVLTQMRSRLGEYRSFAKDGLLPPADEMAGIEATALALGDEGLAAEAADIRQMADFAQTAAKTPPASLQNWINAERARAMEGGATPEVAARINLAETVLSGQTTALARDPLTYANRAGLVAITPLDFTGQDGGASFEARASAARQVSEHYGTPLKFMTDEEAGALNNMVTTGGDQFLAAAAAIETAFAGASTEVYAQVADKNPVFAHAGGLISAGASQTLLEDIAAGVSIAREEGFTTPITPSERRDNSAATLGDAFRYLPRARSSVEQTAAAIHNARSPFAFDAEVYKRALQEAAGATYVDGVRFGGVTKVRGREVLSPTWIRHNRFDDALKTLTSEEIEAAGGTAFDRYGLAVSTVTMRNAYPVLVGDGKYVLSTKNPSTSTPVWLADESGERYVLDLNAARSLIASRRPDWVMP